MVGYVRQSVADIVPGQVVRAAPLNSEFNAIEAAFNSVTGHTHDGTPAGGPILNILTATSGTLTVARGGTGAITASAARTNLGLAIGSNVQAWSARLDGITALSAAGLVAITNASAMVPREIVGTANEITLVNGNGSAGNPVVSLPTALTFTGKTVTGGTFNGITMSSAAVNITGGSISGITDLAVVDGGTGASTAAGARANLGISVVGNTGQATDLVGAINSSIHGAQTDGNLHAVATTSVNGFMSAADKAKLDAGGFVPTGTIIMMPAVGGTPAGYEWCIGQAVSRTGIYADLFAYLGTAFGTGDGTTTFNLPDYRGMFLRGQDAGRGIDPDGSRAANSVQASALGSHSHTASSSSAGNHAHSGTTTTYGHGHTGYTDVQGSHAHTVNVGNGSDTGFAGPFYEGANTLVGGYATSTAGAHSHNLVISVDYHNHTFNTDAAGSHSHTITVNAAGAAETRPINMPVHYFIKL